MSECNCPATEVEVAKRGCELVVRDPEQHSYEYLVTVHDSDVADDCKQAWAEGVAKLCNAMYEAGIGVDEAARRIKGERDGRECGG